MSLRGITFHTEETPQAVMKSDDGLLTLTTNKGSINGFSHVMFATGRKPNTKVNIMPVISTFLNQVCFGGIHLFSGYTSSYNPYLCRIWV